MPTREEILRKVMDTGSLPTLSTVASKLINITAREETTIGDIAALISQDVSLSSKVLRVVNSSFYSFPNEVATIHQAVAILGTNAVRSLVYSFSFLNMERPDHGVGFDYNRFWEQSLAAAVASKLIIGRVSELDPEEVFAASLLQNLGKLILASTYREEYDQMLKDAEGSEVRLLEIETERIGVNHAELGFEAARHWKFPDNLCLPILHHHTPDLYPHKDTRLFTEIRVTHLAGLISNILYSGKPIKYHTPFRERAKAMFSLSTRVIDEILEQIHTEVAQAADFFGLKIGGTPSIPELLQEANIELSLLNMSYEQINRELVQAKVQLEKLTRELETKNRYLESIANLDGLTEIYNHRFFQEFLDKEINRASRKDSDFSLLFADVDYFKRLNDLHGHQTGDQILKQLASLCQEMIRQYDLLARYGGEEFVFVLPETCQKDAMAIAEKIRLAVETHPFAADGETYRITMSFGVASFETSGRPHLSKAELIDRADKALYNAKHRGRNRVEEYTDKKGWFARK